MARASRVAWRRVSIGLAVIDFLFNASKEPLDGEEFFVEIARDGFVAGAHFGGEGVAGGGGDAFDLVDFFKNFVVASGVVADVGIEFFFTGELFVEFFGDFNFDGLGFEFDLGFGFFIHHQPGKGHGADASDGDGEIGGGVPVHLIFESRHRFAGFEPACEAFFAAGAGPGGDGLMGKVGEAAGDDGGEGDGHGDFGSGKIVAGGLGGLGGGLDEGDGVSHGLSWLLRRTTMRTMGIPMTAATLRELKIVQAIIITVYRLLGPRFAGRYRVVWA
jgi:hypothetical protein